MEPRIWSTADSIGAAALRSWRDVIDQSLFSLEIQSSSDSFRARLEQGAMGPALLSKLTAGQQLVRRTPRNIAGTRDRPKLDLICVREGSFRYSQNGHDDVLGAGDCVLLDRSMPYRFEASETCSMTLAFEHDWLARWTPDPGAFAARRIDGAKAWGRALSAMLATLEVDMLDRLALPGGVVADQVAGLLVLACTPDCELQPRRRPIEIRLAELITATAHDPAFDVARAAAALGISRRTLHLLCARGGTSFGTRLMTERLERAHAMLADPRMAGFPVGEIAWRCGFLDQGHFTKRFRARFGIPPSRLRA